MFWPFLTETVLRLPFPLKRQRQILEPLDRKSLLGRIEISTAEVLLDLSEARLLRWLTIRQL